MDSVNEPDAAYFRVDASGDKTYTPDGWPSESYVEIERAKRLFVGFGQIDPQIKTYNFSADASTIFPQDYLQVRTPIKTNSDGDVENGCFYNPKKDTVRMLTGIALLLNTITHGAIVSTTLNMVYKAKLGRPFPGLRQA